ncbi:hypothetical protein [Thiolinea disciformis]|uniref:hypothetical protein n=1 Tax=Thiolinea disciformis TaxID=125614 RepID=UPI00037E1036|nr:hypothetical protein [Thiolinea disciformis]
MTDTYQQLNKHLQDLIKKMQKVQKAIAASGEPASMHELDELKRLGRAYGSTLEQMAAFDTKQAPAKDKRS